SNLKKIEEEEEKIKKEENKMKKLEDIFQFEKNKEFHKHFFIPSFSDAFTKIHDCIDLFGGRVEDTIFVDRCVHGVSCSQMHCIYCSKLEKDISENDYLEKDYCSPEKKDFQTCL